MTIDLHTHSTASDGTDSPAELVAAAAEAGVGTLAITDHDTTAGWAEAAGAASRVGVTLVRGIEISTQYRGISIHLLGYLLDPDDPDLGAELAAARASRDVRLDRIVRRMAADGVPVTVEEVRAQVQDGATVGRPHIADALVASGVVADRDEAFATYLHGSSPYYVPHYAPDALRAVGLVVAAGGVAVIAHPFANRRGRTVGEADVEELATAGLAGLEVGHRDHDAGEQAAAARLVARLGLLATGSSDYHGTGKPNRLGEHTTDPRVLAEIEERSSGVTGILRR